MAGIYLHIPFCKKACVYCDFHFSTLARDRAKMPSILLKEASLRSDYLEKKQLDTIYFGGGTPSVLGPKILQEILDGLRAHFQWDDSAEITIEANPDDLNEDFFKALRDTEINRLSIGIQSFNDADLALMNRAHNARESRLCLELAHKYGFANSTIDLIYALPNQSEKDWQLQMAELLRYELPHFSAYALTVEPKTVLAHWVKQGKLKIEDEVAARHFELLQEFAQEEGYEHYELSNFALAGHRSKHNHAYWEGSSYLGLGPSAHSYNGHARHWNISNNHLYMQKIEAGDFALEEELLTEEARYNEWLMVSLRLEQGLDISRLNPFSREIQNSFWTSFERQRKIGNLVQEGNRVYIPSSKRFFSDGIAAELFHIND